MSIAVIAVRLVHPSSTTMFAIYRYLLSRLVDIVRGLEQWKTKKDKKETMSTTNGCISIFSDLLALLDRWNALRLSSSNPNVSFSRLELGWTLIGTIMRRSTIANSNNEAHPSLSTTTSTDLNNQQQKRSLEDYGFSANLKRRRHLSPQNANIDLNCEQDPMSSPALRKKTRAKSKNQSILNSSTLDTSLETSSIVDNQTPRVSSVPRLSLSLSVSDCIPNRGMLFLQFTFDWWSLLTPDNSHMTHGRADVLWKER